MQNQAGHWFEPLGACRGREFRCRDMVADEPAATWPAN